jgi:LPXTG-motif cell wall-anchored protein
VSAKRVSTRAGSAAAAAVALFGLFATSAFGWCPERDDHKATTPSGSYDQGHYNKPAYEQPDQSAYEKPTPTETTPAPSEAAPAPAEAAPAPAPAEAPAPAPAPTPTPTPTILPEAAPTAPREITGVPPVAVPEQGVKGETGVREEVPRGAIGTPIRISGGAKPTFAPVAEVSTQGSGQLAQTGFNVVILAILGAIALAGSSLLFWRSRTA